MEEKLSQQSRTTYSKSYPNYRPTASPHAASPVTRIAKSGSGSSRNMGIISTKERTTKSVPQTTRHATMVSGMERGKYPRRRIPTDRPVTPNPVDDDEMTSLYSKAGSSVNEFISHFHKLEGRTDSYTIVAANSGAVKHADSTRAQVPEDLDSKIAVKLSAMVDLGFSVEDSGQSSRCCERFGERRRYELCHPADAGKTA